jgi:hypothetical protein
MYFPPFRIPVTKCDDTDPGDFLPALGSASVSTATLDHGFYKIAAAGQGLLWKTGLTPVGASIGSYLAAGDQEVIEVVSDNTLLTWMLEPSASADGNINIVRTVFTEVKTRDPNLG